MPSGRLQRRLQELKDVFPKRGDPASPQPPGHNPSGESTSQVTSTRVKSDSQDPVGNSAFVHRDLWDEAYKVLRNDQKKSALLDRYERVLSTGEASEPLAPIGTRSREAQLVRVIDTRLEEVKTAALKFHVGGREIVVDEVVHGIVQKIITAKDFVSAAVSSEPHAALAWAGVCIILPLLLNPVTQQEEALRGVELISNLITRYRVTEMTYRDSESKYSNLDDQRSMERLKSALEDKIIDVYVKILEFQMCMAYHYSHGRVLRTMREIVIADDWKAMLKGVEDGEAQVSSDSRALDSERIRQGFSQIFVDRVERLTKETSDRRREILSALSSSLDYASTKKIVPLREKGTGQWFLTHPNYHKWHESQDSCFLFLTAGPGYGKSVLMRSLVEMDMAPSTTQITCYFFFKDVGEQQTSPTEALLAILHQLFLQRPNLLRIAEDTFTEFGTNMSTRFTPLWDLLVKCADVEPEPIYCFLDALDECNNEKRSELVEAILEYYGSGTADPQRKGTLKFLVSGRPYFDAGFSAEELTDSLPDDAHLAAENVPVQQEEMDIVIKAHVKRLRLNAEMKDYLAGQLSKKQTESRTYLWLKLVFDYLERNPKLRNAGKNAIDSLIEDAPPSLDAAYEKILDRSSDATLTRRILHIILGALGPLTVAEINVALVSGYSNLQPEEDFQRTITSVCGLFVTILERHVYLLHQSAKDFLINPHGDGVSQDHSSSAWKHSLSTRVSSLKMFDTCLSLLNCSTFRKDPLNNEDIPRDFLHTSGDFRLDRKDQRYDSGLERLLLLQTYAAQYPFLDHAVKYWDIYMDGAGVDDIYNTGSDQHWRELFAGICDLSQHCFWVWFVTSNFALNRDKDWVTINLQSDMRRCETVFLSLQRYLYELAAWYKSSNPPIDAGLAVIFGMRGMVDRTEKGRFDKWTASKGFGLLEELLGPCGKARLNQFHLCYDAEDGNEEACQALLGPDHDRYQVLRDTSTKELHKSFSSLLRPWVAENLGADMIEVIIPATNEIETTQDFEKINSSFEDDIKSCLLFIEAKRAHEGSIRRLLERGANPKVCDRSGRTPLHCLWAGGGSMEAIASLLLSFGADINAMTKEDDTALFESLGEVEHRARVLFFLENGGDISILNVDGCQALRAEDFDDREIQEIVASRVANGEPAEKFARVCPYDPSSDDAASNDGSTSSDKSSLERYGRPLASRHRSQRRRWVKEWRREPHGSVSDDSSTQSQSQRGRDAGT